MGMDQYLLLSILMGWTSIYQLFWCSPGVQGFDTLPYIYIYSTHQKDRTVKFNPNTVINYFSIFKLRIEWNLMGQNIEV